jgi:hypothetical protein
MPPKLQYPLIWFETEFDSTEKVANLLAPEYENGNLTIHDFELAKASNSLQYVTGTLH